MIWKALVGTSRILLLSVLPLIAVFIYLSAADKQSKATCTKQGRLEFAPNKRSAWAWLLMIAYTAYSVSATAMHLRHAPWSLLDVIGAAGVVIVLAMLVAEFPGTIVVTADGLEQIHWLSRNKHIRWDEIKEINTGEASRTITITAASGTKIVHSRQLPDRPRLLLELKQYCGNNLPPDFPREPITDE